MARGTFQGLLAYQMEVDEKREKLKEKIGDHIRDTLLSTANRSAKVGQGGNSTNPTNNDLDVALTSASPTLAIASATNSNIIEAKVTVDGTNIQGKVVREVGIFTGSDMIQRVNFDGVGPFASNEELEIFIIMEVE